MSSLRLSGLCLVALMCTAVQAAEPVTSTGDKAVLRALAPAQINAIRIASRSVLAAKKGAPDDPTDAEHLALLRASVDRLIAADLAPGYPITLEGQESVDQRKSRLSTADRQETSHRGAQALAVQLRGRADVINAQGSSADTGATASGGLPIGAQRARIYERLAQKLDTAIADGQTDRIGQLMDLKRQLQSTQGTVSSTALDRGTPTIQAMPASYVAPAAPNLPSKE